jgi:hypothetical protein
MVSWPVSTSSSQWRPPNRTPSSALMTAFRGREVTESPLLDMGEIVNTFSCRNLRYWIGLILSGFTSKAENENNHWIGLPHKLQKR